MGHAITQRQGSGAREASAQGQDPGHHPPPPTQGQGGTLPMIPQRQCVLFHDSGCRPTPRPVPAQTDLPPPSRRGVMHCGKATSKSGKGCACGGSCFGGCALSTAHVRRRRIQGCLIRQVMIAKKERTWDLGLGLGLEGASSSSSTKRQQAIKQASAAPPARARHPSPTRFLSLLLPVIHSRRVGDARRGKAM